MKTYVLKHDIRRVIFLEVAGVEREIVFKGGSVTPFRNPGQFSTNEEALQNALEESPYYKNGVFYIKEEPIVVEPEETIEPTEPVIIKEVSNWQQAKSYFVKKHKYPMTLNLEGVVEAMKKHNVQFPDWDKK